MIYVQHNLNFLDLEWLTSPKGQVVAHYGLSQESFVDWRET